jgi:hypothetical protein
MQINSKRIISASRRTDLPRYHYQWLQQVLKTGYVEIANPRFPAKVTRVNLRPDQVHAIVLWSKDFANVLRDPLYLRDYNLYFQYTINNYSAALEPNIPEYRHTLETLAGLLKSYCPEQFNIRFDPIIISTAGEHNPNWEKPGRVRLEVFRQLCRDLAALGMQKARITTSYVALYGRVKKNLAGFDYYPLSEQLQVGFFTALADIAAKNGFSIYSCASPVLENVPGIRPGRCIDAELFERLFGGKMSKAKDTGQRQSCRCHRSTEIGDYKLICSGGCRYCYAAMTAKA